jgi:hypothetical protein
MEFSRALVLGVALGALVAGAASAQEAPPEIHVAQGGAGLAVKTHVVKLTRQHYTLTSTISTSVSTSADLHKKALIWPYVWYGAKDCLAPNAQHYQLVQRKTVYALIHTGTSTGTRNGCGTTLFKLRDLYYTLATKGGVGATDHLKVTYVVPFYHGYEVTINDIFNIYIGP